jgi:2-polyprenyl-3-methyl-5-hydroxy-6-metoxy-1,4-benzoquinol methylase
LGKPSFENLFNETQQEVLKHTKHERYALIYKASELGYWDSVAQRIYETAKPPASCLDVGCAYGTLAVFMKKLFPNAEVYCTDFVDIFFAEKLAEAAGLNFKLNNIELDSFPWDIRFDIIVFTEILEHLNFHPLSTLKKLHGLLNPDGVLYISTPNAAYWGKRSYYSSYRDMPKADRPEGVPIRDDHIYHYNEEELTEIFTAAGFSAEMLSAARHFQMALTKDFSQNTFSLLAK